MLTRRICYSTPRRHDDDDVIMTTTKRFRTLSGAHACDSHLLSRLKRADKPSVKPPTSPTPFIARRRQARCHLMGEGKLNTQRDKTLF